MRLAAQLNLYPKKVYKWHWDRKKRISTDPQLDGDFSATLTKENICPTSAAAAEAVSHLAALPELKAGQSEVQQFTQSQIIEEIQDLPAECKNSA